MTEEMKWLVFWVLIAVVLISLYFYKLGWWRGYTAGLRLSEKLFLKEADHD